MHPAGFSCRAGGRLDGGKSTTCPSLRGVTTRNNNNNINNNNMSRILMEYGRLAISLVSELAEKRVPCSETRTEFEKLASVITGTVRKTMNSSGRRATSRTISFAVSDLNLASNPPDEATVMPTLFSESCVLADRNGNATNEGNRRDK